MDQEKDANPIAEIFDEMFTLLEDLETRNLAMLEYLKEQSGVSDEKLAPYLDRAAAASDVRWRAARARMEHLLAPKPKSATEVAKGENAEGASQSQPQEKGKEAHARAEKPQDDKTQNAEPAKSSAKEVERNDETQEQLPGTASSSSDAQAQASTSTGSRQSDTHEGADDRGPSPRSGNRKLTSQSPSGEKQRSHKAAK